MLENDSAARKIPILVANLTYLFGLVMVISTYSDFHNCHQSGRHKHICTWHFFGIIILWNKIRGLCTLKKNLVRSWELVSHIEFCGPHKSTLANLSQETSNNKCTVNSCNKILVFWRAHCPKISYGITEIQHIIYHRDVGNYSTILVWLCFYIICLQIYSLADKLYFRNWRE